MTDFQELRSHLQRLRTEDEVVEPAQAEHVITQVLRVMFVAESYELSANKMDWRLVARRPGDEQSPPVSVAIDYKHYMRGHLVDAATTCEFLEATLKHNLDRAILVARHGFTKHALYEGRREAPVALDLLTLDDLDAWIDRVERGAVEASEKVQLAVRTLAHELALLVAKHPSVLDEIEWRDLERLVTRVLEVLGFKATLTRSSKDEGKDVIVECTVQDGPRSYIIELKHWASGKRVGPAAVTHFVEVVASEKRDGGIFLSTSGYSKNAFTSLTEIVRERIRFGGRAKIVSLAKTYERAGLGLWSAPTTLPEVLFEGTE